jgi:site-specific recombinase XerD
VLEPLARQSSRVTSPILQPGYGLGRRPPNAGLKFPAEVLTPTEINRLLAACSRRSRTGMRDRALIVVLWRGGLRITEALSLELRDVDRELGAVTVRHGKGNRRRVVGLDPQALAVVEDWLDVRATVPGVPPRSGPLFCTVSRGAAGRAVYSSHVRDRLKELAEKAGIHKRVHPHGFRHTHAVELLREGCPITVIQRQLGHTSLATTERYLNHLLPLEVVEAMQARAWPSAVNGASAHG